jgi:small subunit ribosomal protein S6e
VFRINGGFDKDGFAMKQGIFSNNRIRLLLSPGTSGYRAKRKGERKRRSVRGCIVGPDIKALSLTLIKKGDKEIPGLTDDTKARRLGPKRSTGIRKLYGIEKVEGEKTLSSSVALIKKHAIRRTFKSKKNANAAPRHKAPRVQRLVTDVRLRRKRIQKEDKIKRWKRTLALTEEYKKVYDTWAAKKRAVAHDIKQQRKLSKTDSVPGATKAVAKKEEPKKAEVKKVETRAPATKTPAVKAPAVKTPAVKAPAVKAPAKAEKPKK